MIYLGDRSRTLTFFVFFRSSSSWRRCSRDLEYGIWSAPHRVTTTPAVPTQIPKPKTQTSTHDQQHLLPDHPTTLQLQACPALPTPQATITTVNDNPTPNKGRRAQHRPQLCIQTVVPRPPRRAPRNGRDTQRTNHTTKHETAWGASRTSSIL